MNPSFKLFGLVGALLLMQLANPAIADTVTPFATVAFTIPADIHIPVFDIKFSNGYSGSFALDTEATQSFLSDSVVTMLRLKLRPAVFDDGRPIKNNGVQLQMTDANGIKIGDSAGFNLFLVVLKHQNMAPGVDGILGLNFLNSFSTFLDFEKRNLTFWYKTSLDVSERSKLGMDKAVELPITIDANSQLSVEARFNNARSEKVVISTVAAESRISSEAAKELKLHAVSENRKSNEASGTVTYSEAVLEKLALGNLLVKGVKVAYVTDSGAVKTTSLNPCVGRDVLDACRVLIDGPGQRLYLKPREGVSSTGKEAADAGKLVVDLTSAYTQPKIPSFTVTFARIAGFDGPVIEMKLGEKLVGKFLLDSGTPYTMITESAADILRLTPHPSRTTNGVPLTMFNKPTRSVDVSVTIGDQSFGESQLLVVNHKDLPIDVDGILGCNLLTVCSTLIDYGNNKITFWYNSSPTADERAKLGLADAIAVPVTLVDPPAFKVHARYNDNVDDDVVVDTGASASQISLSVARKLKLHPSASPGRAQIFGGTEKINTALLDKLEIGTIIANGVSVEYPARGGSMVVAPCVGLDVLSHFRVLFDAPNHLIYFKALDKDSK